VAPADSTEQLPIQPVPPLAQTIHNARLAIEPLVGGFAFARARFFLNLFELTAKKAQQRLEERTATGANWASEGLLRYYLGCRHGLPYHVGWPVILEDDPKALSVCARAASLVAAALTLRQQMQSGRYARDRDGVTPLEMQQYANIFSTTRVPRAGCDDLVTAAANTQLAVMARGTIYCLDVGAGASAAVLRKAFESILQDAQSRPAGVVGELTAAAREDWAQARARLLKNNRAALEQVESSLMLVCLDDQHSPQTLSETAQRVRDGNPHNRWYDRSVQLVVFGNGKAGLWVEHSALDGDPATRFGAALWELGSASSQHLDETVAGSLPFRPLDWALDADAEEDLRRARAYSERLLGNREVLTLQIAGLGTSSLKKSVSLGALIQLAIQLGCLRHFGKLLSVVEPVQTRRFRGGRFDGFMTVTAASKAFVEAAQVPARAGELPELLRAATQSHFAQLVRSKKGSGWHSHISGLSAMDFPADRVKGVVAEDGKRRMMAKLDAGMRILGKWEMNAGSVPALRGVLSAGNVGIAPQMMALGYILKEDALVVDLRADGDYRGHCGPLIESVTEAIRFITAIPSAS
jgi:carnitine O-acetyltransferase